MASFSIHVGDNSHFHSEFREIQPRINDRDIPICNSVPRHLWTTKCITLHNDDKVVVAEGISHNVRFDLVIGKERPLGGHMLLFRYQGVLRRMSSLTIGGI
jgi:hypothetical protein